MGSHSICGGDRMVDISDHDPAAGLGVKRIQPVYKSKMEGSTQAKYEILYV